MVEDMVCKWWKFVCGRACTLGLKEEIFFSFVYVVFLLLFYYPSFLGMMRADPVVTGGGAV